MEIRSSLKKRSIFALGIYLCLFIATFGSLTYFVVEKPIRSKLEQNLDLRTELLASNLQLSLERSLGSLHSLVAIIENEPTKETLPPLIAKVIVHSDKAVVSGGIWPEPYVLDKNVRLNSLFYNKREDGGVDRIASWNNPQSNGYNLEAWYTGAARLSVGQVDWSEVYIDPYTHVQMITASTPYYKQGELQGVATVDISLDAIVREMQWQANQYRLGVLLKDALGNSIHEHNFRLSDNLYVSSLSFGPFEWQIDVINSQRKVAEEAFDLVTDLELILLTLLLIGVMAGYYLIRRNLIDPIVVLADKVSNTPAGQKIDMLYKRDDEILHLIDCFDQKTQFLEEEKVRAQASTKAKTAFLATLSHEIRTPMNGVLGTAQILLKTPLDEQQSKLLHSLYDSGEHMMTLLNEILDFSKIEQGKLELEKAPFAMAAIVGSIQSVYHTLASEKGLNFKIHSELPDNRWYNSDKARIRQVMFNLLNNAIKFTSRGFVEVYLKEETLNGTTYLSIQIRDTGVGISEEAQKRIFKPFEQAETSTTRKFGGTGLGLAIVKKIILGMQGDIQVESEEGVGSSFYVKIAVEPCEARVKEVTANTSVNCDGLTVLIVEDNRTNTMIIDAFMRGKGFATTSVQDGKQAVDIMAKQSFDLILMDNHMPVMDGIEATRQIRLMPKPASETLIIGCTADVFKETREKMMQAGVDDIVAKPIDETELDDVLLMHSNRLKNAVSRVQHEPVEPHQPAGLTFEQLLVDLYVHVENQSFEKANDAIKQMRINCQKQKNSDALEVVERIGAALDNQLLPAQEDLDYLTLNPLSD
ncbi:hybrid sensor histidine kinase/response regulator [Vibrio sp. SCSIO 43136]|uniref:hybrid sensor histidine kinase/response regulator n=1 Tax=Vibrio sp. SCSIO 43136 TaxID=2819101 RepID=UPI002075B76B|nr:hybrid sensor histidine kinase/response regulator [Vibrio sp. SCSIO 43136]USD64312.1 response regulator [Vibrio sp. SCSIO 43136]